MTGTFRWRLSSRPSEGWERGGVNATLPFNQFVIKVHSRCDLACDHCYVYEHADQSWRARPTVMSADTAAWAARRIAEHVKRHDLDDFHIVLHGGEPLLAGHERLAEIVSTL